MGSIWKYKYGEHTIIVKNEKTTELYVDDKLQDKKSGVRLNADLTGKLPSGETIKASLGGFVDIECSLFVDNVLQNPIEIS